MNLPGADAGNFPQWIEASCFDDFDGDGALDVVLVPPRQFEIGESEHTLAAISLRDGKRLWSQPFNADSRYPVQVSRKPVICKCGGKRPRRCGDRPAV